ncbi:AMP-binding protein, partial [Brasilonema sp. CT11]|nr:AMP-binding protein [Brasilonema sp. CT11]
GKPKGVLVPHRALANFVDWELSEFKYPYGMTFMQMFEFSFDASLQDVFACLCSGNRLLLAKEKGNKDPEYLVNQFAKYNVSRTNMVPSQLSLVLEYLTQDPSAVTKCKSLRTVGQGGEALHLSSVERVHKILPHVQIVNFYGPTEACILCSYFDCGSSSDSIISDLKQWAKGVASSAAEIIPIGRPINNASMIILDEDMNLAPVGVSGEVFIGGQCLALGYLNNPEQTTSKFITNPFNANEVLYASGDLAKYLPNGLIQYLGRKDKQIKLRGYRIECAEIESVILFNKQVIKAFVTVKKNGASEYLAAYLTTDASVKDKKPLLEQILQDLKAKLPSYMVPSRMFWMSTFPLTINGKVDEAQLPTDLETSATVFGISASVNNATITPPKDEVEKSLCTYITSLLHLPESQVGTNSNFFEIGGTSIHAFNIVSMVKQNFGYKLDLQLFFKDPTVAALANLIRSSDTSAEAMEEMKKFSITTLENYEIVKLKNASDSPSLNVFLVHGAFRNTSVFNNLVQHFPSNFNVYAFQDTNPLDVEELDWDDPFEMEQMAAKYVEKILTVQPSGSYHICGYCFGGVLAVEMAMQLLEKKKNVCTLALLDSTAPTAANARGFSTLDSATIYALLATEVM